jgi:hypothetical protein
MPRLFSRYIVLEITMAGAGIGCAAWRPEPGGVGTALERQPREIRVVQRDSSRTVMFAPTLRGDTLIGTGRGSRPEVRLLVPQIVEVQVRKADLASTATLVSGIAVLVMVGVVAAQSAVGNALSNSLAH